MPLKNLTIITKNSIIVSVITHINEKSSDTHFECRCFGNMEESYSVANLEYSART